jgi:hypothetical protein
LQEINWERWTVVKLGTLSREELTEVATVSGDEKRWAR